MLTMVVRKLYRGFGEKAETYTFALPIPIAIGRLVLGRVVIEYAKEIVSQDISLVRARSALYQLETTYGNTEEWQSGRMRRS
jgi:3-methyladenine DNA glycosylase/8-oxoguanine DNA glycosylase